MKMKVDGERAIDKIQYPFMMKMLKQTTTKKNPFVKKETSWIWYSASMKSLQVALHLWFMVMVNDFPLRLRIK